MTFRCLLAAMLFLLVPFGAASAQDAEAPAATDPAEPAGSAWIVNCSSAASGELACLMSQNLTQKETGRRVLTVTVRRQGEEGELVMLLALPHGLYLPAGATYQVDDGQEATAAIQTSDQNGAYAAVPLSDGLLGALKKGTSLNIGVESAARQKVMIPVSLSGFTTAVEQLDAVN